MSEPTRRTTTADHDEGSALIIVLAFITFVGLVVTATLGYAGSSFALSATTRDIEQREAAADGGAKYAVARIVADAASCTGAMPGAPATNGYTPTVTCTTRSGSAYSDGTGWGVYITDTNGQIATQSGGGSDPDKRKVNGPVYNHSTSDPWDLQAPLLVTNGGVLQRITSTGCVQDGRLTVQGTGSYACTPPVLQPSQPGPTQRLPSSPNVLPDRAASGAGDSGSCRVFEPGRYASTPQLLAQNYFRSGVYFFEHGIGDVSGLDVLAGSPPSTETAMLLNTAADPARVPCAVPEATGVQFIFGGDGYLFAHNGASVEIHSMARGDVTGTSVYRLRATDPGGWGAYASTRTGLGDPIVQSGQGGNANLVIHGLVYVPGGGLDLEGKQSDVAQVKGGVVAGAVRLQAAASMTQGVQIHAGEQFTFTLYVITATVAGGDGRTVDVSVALRRPADDPTHPVIYSWTVD